MQHLIVVAHALEDSIPMKLAPTHALECNSSGTAGRRRQAALMVWEPHKRRPLFLRATFRAGRGCNHASRALTLDVQTRRSKE